MSFFNKIFRSKNKKNNNVEEVSIKPIEGEKEDLSSISPVDNDVNNTKTTNTEKSTEPETSVKNNELSKILSNAKTALKQEQVNVNSNDDIMKRLENIKKNSETITDYSEYKSDFQKMLDRVKKDNFEERMQYIKGKISTANRIKTNNTNEEKTSEEVILNNIRTERTRILNSKLDIFKKNIEDNKVKTGDEIDKNKDVSEEKENNEEVTLSKENFEKIIFETINDVVESVGLDIFSIVTKYKKDIEK